ncbi:PX domain-containing protein ypt35 [Orbilia ellipsospora]|uniref:Endosomal/vacuolar adapter protein YPT35 n=1 Tax=Orbilia ellipsospora TaxID=2528407 RepID=A0AAV9X7E1_9PEZI
MASQPGLAGVTCWDLSVSPTLTPRKCITFPLPQPEVYVFFLSFHFFSTLEFLLVTPWIPRMESQSDTQTPALPPLDTYDPLRDDLQNFRNSTDGTGASPTGVNRFHSFKGLPSSTPSSPTSGPRRASLPFQRNRNRTASGASMTYLQPSPINLVDHTVEPSERSAAAFARSVIVGDYTIISGSPLRAGAYVVWNCTVETLEGQKFTVIKRYSEFDTLRERLLAAFPKSKAALPQLPRKSVVSRFRTKFLDSRRQGLNYFLSCILMNPEFAGSPMVKEFLFNRD